MNKELKELAVAEITKVFQDTGEHLAVEGERWTHMEHSLAGAKYSFDALEAIFGSYFKGLKEEKPVPLTVATKVPEEVYFDPELKAMHLTIEALGGLMINAQLNVLDYLVSRYQLK